MREASSFTLARVSINRTSEAIVSEVMLGMSMMSMTEAGVFVVVWAGGVGGT